MEAKRWSLATLTFIDYGFPSDDGLTRIIALLVLSEP